MRTLLISPPSQLLRVVDEKERPFHSPVVSDSGFSVTDADGWARALRVIHSQFVLGIRGTSYHSPAVSGTLSPAHIFFESANGWKVKSVLACGQFWQSSAVVAVDFLFVFYHSRAC